MGPASSARLALQEAATEAGAEDRPGPTPDLRLPVLAVGAWLGGLFLVTGSDVGLLVLVLASLTLGWLLRRHRSTLVATILVGLAVAGSAAMRQHTVTDSPLADLAERRAAVEMRLTLTSDPRLHQGQYADYVLVHARAAGVVSDGLGYDTGVPVLVIADPAWHDLQLGSEVVTQGRLSRADGPDVGAVLDAGGVRVVRRPGPAWRAAAAVRASIRESVAGQPPPERALVPALVVGDDQGMPEDVAEDFRTTGLTHLLAVSGTNLTLMVGALVLLARWCRVRGRWLYLVAVLGIAGFVLLARTEPSVVRAAAMGAVGLLAMGSNGRQRGVRALGLAVLVLLLVDPSMAASLGFALSVSATAGILLLGPGFRDALRCWLPRGAAEAVAVPLAAQLACTPLVAAISGQVSLAAVTANLAVAPVVGPATVLGILGGLLGLVHSGTGELVGTGAAWCARWIITVARYGADLPTPAMDWGTGWPSLVGLTLGCVVLAIGLPWVLRRRLAGCCAVVVLVAGSFVRLPTPGWPPPGWVMVACDVGQGDALALRTGPDAAMVVDAGPDPRPVRRCLDRLGVEHVPAVVLTHFHDDHVAGLPGVLAGRRVDQILVTAVREPAGGAELVEEAAAEAGVPVGVPGFGTRFRLGDVTAQVLGPVAGSTEGPVAGGPVDAEADSGEESSANNASLVLRVESGGISLLLTGDMEPEAQEALAETWPGLRADVLKVPHHGSSHQDLELLTGLGARLAVISVGADNDYGHPSSQVLLPLEGAGVEIARTDESGDVAVVSREGELRVVGH